MSKIFGLADCNNFFVSCEKAFRPDLAHRPVVVLSNNDGCVISRSAEVKAMGIPMGAPRFQIDAEIKKHNIAVFSSNFALYGDMSNRVISTIRLFTPDVEQYSIDEAFFNASAVAAFKANLTVSGQQMRQYILRTTGIPVSIGFAPSKTLAKLANYYVKKNPQYEGVLDLTGKEMQQRLLYSCPLSDIWGVGRQLLQQLYRINIRTPFELAQSDYNAMGRRFGVNMQKTILELNGISCYEFAEEPVTRQSIMHSSTMGSPSDVMQVVSQALCGHIESACQSMRREKLCTSCLTVFYRTGAFKSHNEFFSTSLSHAFVTPTNDTMQIVHSGIDLLKRTWQQGFFISKVGIILSELTDENNVQFNMFESDRGNPKNKKLMEVMDQINLTTHGNVFLLGQGIRKPWGSCRKYCSPHYTTSWNDIIRVK